MTRSGTCHFVFRLRGVVAQAASTNHRMTPGMRELLRELSEDFNLWLFCEETEEELSPLVGGLRLDEIFPGERQLFASGRFSVDAPTQLIDELLERTGGRRKELLWIDDRPVVTSAVIRAGVNAVIFVDAFRLRRNLMLRGLVK